MKGTTVERRGGGAFVARTVVTLCVLILLGLAFSLPTSAQGAVAVSINSASYGTSGFYNGVFVNITNGSPLTLNLVPFAVWKDSQGQTVAVTTGGLTLASGATDIAFAPSLNALPSGHYVVFIFVVDTYNSPVSTVTTISLYVY